MWKWAIKYWGQKKGYHALWFILVIFMLIGAVKAPINIDEVIHYEHAQKVVNWYATGGQDASCLYTPQSNLKYYGQSIDNLTALLNRVFKIDDQYLTRHFVGWIIASLLLLVTGLIAFEVSNKWKVASLAMFLLFLSPRPMGQAFNNLKDIPFALGYGWSLLCMIRMVKHFPQVTWKNTIHLALAIAFTNSLRIGGMVLIPYLGLFLMVMLFQYPQELQKKAFYKNWIPKGIAILVIGYFGSLIFWPYGLQNPLLHPAKALAVMEHYVISIRQIFEGTYYWSTDLPWYYLPKWMLISIPEIVWLGLLAWFISIFKNQNSNWMNIKWLVLWFSLLFPVIYVMVIDANLYSGWRQMYFVYIPFVAIAANGLFAFVNSVQNPTTRKIQVVAFLLLCISPFLHNPLTLSSDYVYFNSISGGNSSAWSNYEYDYYWNDIQKGVNYFKENIADKDSSYTIASNFLIEPYFQGSPYRFEFVPYIEKSGVDYDYGIFGVNFIHPYRLKKNNWKSTATLKVISHMNHPTVVVDKANNRLAINGISAFRNKEFYFARDYFEAALSEDKTDINLLSYLANCVLNVNDFTKFDTLMNRAERIQPNYEPMLLLNAQKWYGLQYYDKAWNEMEKLLKVNPRYESAVPLLIKLYEQQGEIEKANILKDKFETN